jgi:hypothetical protein
VSTWNGFGTALRGYGRRAPDGSHHATQWVVAAGLPLVPLRRLRLLAGASTTTSGASRITTSRPVTVLEATPLRVAEVLLTYLMWWLIGPAVVVAPLLAVTVLMDHGVLPDTDALTGVVFCPALIWFFFGAMILNAVTRRVRRLPG